MAIDSALTTTDCQVGFAEAIATLRAWSGRNGYQTYT